MSNVSTRRGGRTRWRRFAVVVVPSMALALGIVALEAQGALAASFAVSGLKSSITADSIVGKGGFNQYGYVDAIKGNPMKAVPVAITSIGNATITNLCQSVVVPVPMLGDVELVIHAGQDPQHPVTATNMVIDTDHLTGDAEFSNIDIGIDATSMTKGPAPKQAQQNMFGQQADTVTITNLKQSAYATSAGTFSLTGMSLDLKMGTADVCKM